MEELGLYVQIDLTPDKQGSFNFRSCERGPVEKPRTYLDFSMKDQFSRTFSSQVFSLQKPLEVAGARRAVGAAGHGVNWS